MQLRQTYARVKDAIVAFVYRYCFVRENLGEELPEFPAIIGTGFLARPDGTVVTNAHVAKHIVQAPKPPGRPADEWPVLAILLRHHEMGMLRVPLPILAVVQVELLVPAGVYYGPREGPDLALVRVGLRDLPTVEQIAEEPPNVGDEVATAGFPMGTDALTAPGWLHQLTPTLQSGIVSAVLPFPCAKPHAFSVNIMTQTGASGSPVFRPEDGVVTGVLYGGLQDIWQDPGTRTKYAVPTNISYVVPAHYIRKALGNVHEDPEWPDNSNCPTLADVLTTAEFREAQHVWRPADDARRATDVVDLIRPPAGMSDSRDSDGGGLSTALDSDTD